MNFINKSENKNDVPVAHFDKKSGLISISGRSIRVNSNPFWQLVKIRLKNHMEKSHAITSIRLQMEYMNSSSVEELLEFLNLSKSLTKNDAELKVEWLYEEGDEDVLELGNCINQVIDLPMKCVQMN